ncbi:hypothetical protein ACRRS0_05485 [Agarivorans sp. QJM3NY_29]|uniref:hypothetical protein n=1 Tax=unclassified Agarivorans TaxID=2636026 RepID=UPI003D7E9E2E
MSILKLIKLCLLAALMSGCAISNEGATDYRYYNPTDNTAGKYIKPKDVKNSQLAIGDGLVVSIKQMYIQEFTEWRSPLSVLRGEPTNGEIAIVVNAFEQGTESLNFGSKGLENARVVFFSDDVREGQTLNFSNLSTIYGPLKYNGNNFVIDLYIVEFDKPGEQLKQLIKNLSELGSTFYPPASPLSGALSQLAGSLVTDQQEDRVFHYTYELKPVGGDPNLETSILLTGNYAFIREDDRHNITNWAELSINPKNGRIVYKTIEKKDADNKIISIDCNDPSKESPAECFYTDNTYIVIEVNKASSSLKNDTQQMVYKDLVSNLASTSAELYRTDLPETLLSNLVQGVSELRTSEQIISELEILSSADNTLDSNNAALASFLNLWFSLDPANHNESRYQLNSLEQQRLERKIVALVAQCTPDQSKIVSTMTLLRDRVAGLPTASSQQVIDSLSCHHQ